MKKKELLSRFISGAVIFGSISAVATGIVATSSVQKFYVDGVQTPMEAYSINGNNYVKLRDIGKVVDFGVTYDSSTDSVQMDSTGSYIDEGVDTLNMAEPADGLRVMTVGTGTPDFELGRGGGSALVQYKDKYFLVDCGSMASYTLEKMA